MTLKIASILLLAPAALFTTEQDKPQRVMPFEELSIAFEVNANDVDGEIVIHAESGQPLERVAMIDPRGRTVQGVASAPGGIGLSEFRLESGEPKIATVRETFPEGTYTVRGRTIDGGFVEGTVELSHRVPARCSILAPSASAQPSPDAVTIEWHGDPSVTKFSVELESPDDEELLHVNLPSHTSSLKVPEGLLQPETEYQIVLVTHSVEGNRTVQETWFTTGR